MKFDDRKILDWVTWKIKSEYPNDVALLVGHCFEKPESTSGDDSFEQFKGDFDYFVPENPRAYELSKSFIVNGIGYDLYPRSWESIESMAELNDCHTSCLANANILYVRSEAALNRFEAIRQKLFDNLKNKPFVYGKAKDRLNMAKEIYLTMTFSQSGDEIRESSGFILDYLAQSIAFVNGSFFKQGAMYQLEEMASFKEVPQDFAKGYEAVIRCESQEELAGLCHALIVRVQSFLMAHKPQMTVLRKPDYHGLADWYQEFSHLWRQIYNGCTLGDVPRVFFWSCSLQHELYVVREEFGLAEMNLLSCYCVQDLAALHIRAQEIERYIKDTIVKNSVNIELYPTIEEFLEKN